MAGAVSTKLVKTMYAADWAANDPLLDEGEIGTEIDTGVFKVGDGTTRYSQLPEISGNVLSNFIAKEDTTDPAQGYGVVIGPSTTLAEDIGPGSVLLNADTAFPNLMPGRQRLRGIVGGYDNSIVGSNAGDSSGLACGIVLSQHSTITGLATHCFIAGGSYLDIAAGDYSVAVGGQLNDITGGGDYLSIFGGGSNLINLASGQDYASIVGGRDNAINAEYGGTVGGRDCSVTGEAAVAVGYGAVTAHAGSLARAGGYFSTAGDAMASDVVMRRQTTDATPTELRLNSTLGTRLVLVNDSTYAFSALIVGRATGAEEGAAYELKGCINVSSGGTTSLIGSITKTVIAESVAAWDVTAVADNTNKALQINVTGEAGKTINWVADVKLVKVTG